MASSRSVCALRDQCMLPSEAVTTAAPISIFSATRGVLPPLRCGRIIPDRAEHFLRDRGASVATPRGWSESSRNAVRLRNERSVSPEFPLPLTLRASPIAIGSRTKYHAQRTGLKIAIAGLRWHAVVVASRVWQSYRRFAPARAVIAIRKLQIALLAQSVRRSERLTRDSCLRSRLRLVAL